MENITMEDIWGNAQSKSIFELRGHSTVVTNQHLKVNNFILKMRTSQLNFELYESNAEENV